MRSGAGPVISLPLAIAGLRARWVLVAYLVVGALNVAGNLASAPLAAATKPLLMPLLVVWALANALRSSRAATAILLGLLLAWAGDLLLMVPMLVTGMAAFAVMQVAYLVAFRALPGPGLVRAWPLATVPFAAAWLVITVAIWPTAGDLRSPIAAYGLLLVAMACSALDTSLRLPPGTRWWLPLGGALFVLSDALIALGIAERIAEGPVVDAAIMATYIAAQLLIVVSVIVATHAQPVDSTGSTGSAA